MPNLARLTLIGHLGHDASVRTLDSGATVVSFSVAVTEKFTKQGERVEQTTWFDCSAWDKTASGIAPALTKGAAVYVEGSLATRVYTGRDGTQKTALDVRANKVLLLSRKASQASYDVPEPAQRPSSRLPVLPTMAPTFNEATAEADAVYDDAVPF